MGTERLQARIGSLVVLAVAVGIAFQPLGLKLIDTLQQARESPLLWHEGDAPCLELGTIQASEFTQSLGVYSRFGGHHLGPLYFYWLAPFYVMFGRNATAMAVGVVSLHLLAVCGVLGVVILARRRYGCVMLFPCLVLLTMYLRLIPLNDIWNPYVLALPLCFLLYAAALLAMGHAPVMPLLFLAGTYGIQTHFGTGLCVIAVIVFSVTVYLFRMARSGEWSTKPLVFWGGVTCASMLIAWFPPFYEEITNYPGNISKFVHFFMDSSSGHESLMDGMTHMACKVSWVASMVKVSGISLSPHIIGHVSLAVAACQLVATIVIGVSKRACSYCRSLAFVTLVAMLAAFISVKNIRMGFCDFLFDWMSAIGFVSYAVILTSLMPVRWKALWPYDPAHERRRGPVHQMALAAIAVVLILAPTLSVAAFDRCFRQAGRASQGSRRVHLLSERLMDFLHKRNSARPVLWACPDQLKWAVTNGIALELVKAKQALSLGPYNRFGGRFDASPRDDADILISNRPLPPNAGVTIAGPELFGEEVTSIAGEGNTYIHSLELPPFLTAKTLVQVMNDVFDCPLRSIPPSVARKIWRAVHSSSPEGTVVYSGVEPVSADLLQPLHQVSVHARSDGLLIVSTGSDPAVVTPPLHLPAGTHVYFLMLDLTLDHNDRGQIFYVRSDKDFSEQDSTTLALVSGRNQVCIPLCAPETVQRIRLDPGTRPGTYVIKELAIKALPGDAQILSRARGIDTRGQSTPP